MKEYTKEANSNLVFHCAIFLKQIYSSPRIIYDYYKKIKQMQEVPNPTYQL